MNIHKQRIYLIFLLILSMMTLSFSIARIWIEYAEFPRLRERIAQLETSAGQPVSPQFQNKDEYSVLIPSLIAGIAILFPSLLELVTRITADDRQEFNRKRYDALMELAAALLRFRNQDGRKKLAKNKKLVEDAFTKHIAVLPDTIAEKMVCLLQADSSTESVDEIIFLCRDGVSASKMNMSFKLGRSKALTVERPTT